MADGQKTQLRLEIAHVLFMDIVGYSKLLIDEQSEALQELNEIVRRTEAVRAAEEAGQLIFLPTGDGMALVFTGSVEDPVECALQISQALREQPSLPVRTGIHSGPVHHVADVNQRENIAGAGINIAQRVMDCGDAGHILVSKRVADDLSQYRRWQPYLHELGDLEVKHGLVVSVVNLYDDVVGNSEPPAKFKDKAGGVSKPGSSAATKPKKIPWHEAVLAILLLAGLIAAGVFFMAGRARHTEPQITDSGRPGPTAAGSVYNKSIAVLPFENLSENKENAFFADGVQDEILTNLAKVADLKVISRTSVIGYRDTAGRNLRKIGQELGVAHLVEGSVQRAGNRVRVNAQLVDARTDAHQWAQTYDRDLADVFAIQSEIAKAIADQLQARLSPQEKAEIDRAPTTNLAAFDLYTRAKQLSERGSYSTQGSEFTRQAVELLNQAVALDPNFFLAYCQLQYAHESLYFFNVDRTPARRALGQAALKAAIRLRPDAGETHLAIAGDLYRINLDYDGARAELEKARQTLPNNSQLYEWTGYIDRRQGRWEESVRSHRRALELDPRNHFLYQQISLTYAHLRSYREMAAALDQTLKLIPGDIESRLARGAVDLLESADTEPLNRTIHDIVEHNPDGESLVAEQWFYVADARRDVTEGERAASALPATGLTQNGLVFPRPFCRANFAKIRGDQAAMRDLLLEARKETELKLQAAPDYAPTLLVLGLIDAGLGRKDDAIREGRRAAELMPITKESIAGANIITNLVVIYAWTGEKDLALDELAKSASIPAGVSYGELKTRSDLDSLRGDPRLEKIVASLAPKE
jgi:TolB-like protein/class 3 adenylate cyclase/Flp pilus assembly protein TadD